MEKQLTSRQAGVLLFISIIANKVLILPGILAYSCKNDAVFIFLASFVIDFLYALIFLTMMNKLDCSLFEYIQKILGKLVGYIIAILIGALFLFKTIEIVAQNYMMLNQVMYIDFNKVFSEIFFIILIVLFGSRQLRSLGRTSEILIYIIVFSLIISIVISFSAVTFDNILPLLSVPLKTLSLSSIKHNLWFGDFIVMTFFFGNVKIRSGEKKTIIFFYLLGIVFTLIVAIMFLMVFGETASLHRNALMDMTEYSPRLISEGKFNWLVDFTFPICSFLGIGIYSYCGINSIEFCLKKICKSNKTVSVLIFTSFVVLIALLVSNSYIRYYLFLTDYVFLYGLFIQYLLPLIIMVFAGIKYRKRRKTIYDRKNSKK